MFFRLTGRRTPGKWHERRPYQPYASTNPMYRSLCGKRYPFYVCESNDMPLDDPREAFCETCVRLNDRLTGRGDSGKIE